MNIEEKIKKIIAGEMGFDIEDVTPNTNLEYDLGCDSLDKVEIIMRIEEDFDIDVRDEDVEGVKTVGDAVKLVTKITAGSD